MLDYIIIAKKQTTHYKYYAWLGTEIERVNQVKDLGVILDSQLTFKPHISFTVDKASRVLGFIFRTANLSALF